MAAENANGGGGVLLGQLIRFGVSGVLLTIFVAGLYWVLATPFAIDAMVSLTIAYAIGTAAGFVVHSEYSFKGHGSRDRPAVRTARFFMVNGLGFLLNQFFVWLLVKHLDGPTWWPIVPMLFVTPLVTFGLNRRWVFA
jgi:putative flippase GtrA